MEEWRYSSTALVLSASGEVRPLVPAGKRVAIPTELSLVRDMQAPARIQHGGHSRPALSLAVGTRGHMFADPCLGGKREMPET
jgi:hypothetical protein